MARRPLRFRSILAAVLVCFLTAPAQANVPIGKYAVYVDGVQARSIAGFSDGAHLMVSLENVAAALKYSLKRAGATRILRVNDDVYSFSPGQSGVLLGSDIILETSALPVVRDRMLFVATGDLQTVLSQAFAVNANRIDISAGQTPLDVHTAPLLRPRVSTYTVRSESGTATPRQLASDPTNALVVHAEIANSGGFSSRDLSFTTEGTRMRGSVALSAFDNSSPALSGQVTIGTGDRYAQFGYESNPLSGLMFDAPGGTGVNIRRGDLTYGTEHDSLGRTILFIRRERENGAAFYGLLRANGTTTMITGYRSSVDGIVKVTREVWLTGSGAAASFSVATQGRVFGEAVASATLGNVPLTIGEAPERVDLGFRASNHLTLRAGATSGYHLAATPYVAASIFGTSGTTGSLQLAGKYRTASVSYAGLQGQLAGSYTTSPDGASWSLFGSVTQRRRLLEFSAYQSAGNQDDIIRTHTSAGPGFILGVERVVSGGRTRLGPVFGIGLPISLSSSFDLTEHPTVSGRALGFGFTQRIAFAARVRMHVIGIQHGAPSELYVDDHLERRIDAVVMSIGVTAGNHRVQARSIDGAYASLPAAIDDSTMTVDLALLPVRQIAGRVVELNADPAGRKIQLDHIQIELEPGDVLTETEVDGTFIFPATPTAPNARVAIVMESLPKDLTVGDDAPANAVPLTLSVKTRVKVHRKIF